MSRLRDALATVGIVTVGAGLLFVAEPSFAAVLSVPRAALFILGALAVVEGLRSIQTRRRNEVEGAEPPDTETGIDRSPPGEEFDRLVVRWSSWQDHRRIANVDARVTDRLRDVAVLTIADRDGVTTDEAEDRVEAGTWTDDPVAAAFIGGTDAPRPPLLVRLRGIIRAGSGARFRVDRTVDAIVDRWRDR